MINIALAKSSTCKNSLIAFPDPHTKTSVLFFFAIKNFEINPGITWLELISKLSLTPYTFVGIKQMTSKLNCSNNIEQCLIPAIFAIAYASLVFSNLPLIKYSSFIGILDSFG